MTQMLDDRVAELRRQVADLEQRLRERTAERDEEQAQKAAMAEVLLVINSSPGELAPVFDAMLEKATRVCSADAGVLCTYDGESFWPMALLGLDGFPTNAIHPHPETGIGRLAQGEQIVHILDSAADRKSVV